MRILWTVESRNRKTGNIPQGIIGADRGETLASCRGCQLLGNGCYAWRGNVNCASGSVQRRRTDPTIGAVLKTRPDARAVRIGMIGDPARAHRPTIRRAIDVIRSSGKAVLAYSHHWRRSRSSWARTAWMASCETLADADVAIRQGWRPTAIVDAATATPTVETPDGHTLAVCPAQRVDGVQCASCRMCDAGSAYWTRQDKIHGVAFLKH